MVTEGQGRRSSWQSWVEASRRPAGGDPAGGPAAAEVHALDQGDEAEDAEVDPAGSGWEPTEGGTGTADAGEDVASPVEVPGGSGDAADDDLDVVLEWGTDQEGADGLWTAEPDDEDGADDDAEDLGELLPSVPLLPAIAGRVDALSGVLRSISHRVDGLTGATDVYRATIVDRIDEFTETVLEQGRRSDQNLDEYRRTTERTIAELRRRITEQGEVAGRLLARVEEVATDVASLAASGGPSSGGGGVADGAVADLVAAQQATDRTLGHIRELLEVVVDTMPASAEGSGADLGAAIGEVKDAVERLAAKRQPVAPAPPASAALDPSAVEHLADAVVARLDLDALALLVAEHLAAGFEVVPEADPAPPPAPEADPPPPPAKGRSRRRS